MGTKLRLKIGVWMARFRFRKESYRQTEFTRTFTNARTALVIAPSDSAHRALAIPLLTSLQNKFRGNKLTIVTLDSFRDLSGSLAHCSVVPVRREHMSFFFLPKRRTLQQLFGQKFDIAVDLNIPFVLPAAYICRSANAGVRVGFTKDHADTFYNFQFNTSEQKSPQARYAQLLQTLAMF